MSPCASLTSEDIGAAGPPDARVEALAIIGPSLGTEKTAPSRGPLGTTLPPSLARAESAGTSEARRISSTTKQLVVPEMLALGPLGRTRMNRWIVTSPPRVAD